VGLSIATTRKILAMLQVMLAYAISLDLIAFNAARDVEVIGRRDEGMQRIEPPSKEVMRHRACRRAVPGQADLCFRHRSARQRIACLALAAYRPRNAARPVDGHSGLQVTMDRYGTSSVPSIMVA
jgi:hypothetical protein